MGGAAIRGSSQADERRYQDLRHRFLARQRRPGEATGASGVERAFEAVLRGDRGYQQVVQGGEGGSRPLEMVFEPPRHGQDVVLALDVELQQEAIRAVRKAYREAAAELLPHDDRWASDADRLRRVRAALESPRAGFVLIDLRDGGLPVNVSGGLQSKGHPISATGIANIWEVCQHVRGECGDRQIEGAKVGLAHVIGLGSACGVHILEKAAA